MMKKIFAIALAISISFWAVAPSASALTEEEIQVMINDLLAQIAILQSQLTGGGTPGVITGCTITSFDRNLSQGMTGDDVKCLQIVLNSATDTKLADSGAGSPGNETSYFGPITKAAVIKFQEKFAAEVLASWGLTSGTGYVGSTTRSKLDTLLVAEPEGAECTTSADCSSGQTCVAGSCTIIITGEGFSVELSADTPEAGTMVIDNSPAAGTDGTQALIPVLTIKFTNGTASDIDVDTVMVKRGGISADADISQGYLYDKDGNQITQYNSFSSGVMTFTKSGGLFTVEAGTTETVTIKIDLTNGTATGKTYKFSILSAGYIGSDAATVEGTFPIVSNIFTIAGAADLGKLTVATTTAPATAVDPQDDFELFPFTLLASDQKLEVRKIKFTNMGSCDDNDIINFELFDSGSLIASIASMENGILTFDFTGDPLVIEQGVTKTLYLKGDIAGGTNRTFQFSIQEQTDIEVFDTEYGVYIKPDAAGWVVHKYTATTINTGKLSLSRASDSPSGNIANSAVNQTLSKFDIKAVGEDVKITQLTVDIYGTLNAVGLYQAKIYYDGNQKGSTANIASGAAAGTADGTYTFGNTFIIPADGAFHTLEIRSDVKASSSAALTAGNTVNAAVLAITAAGRTSLATVGSVAGSGHQLTVSAGTLSVSKNNAISNWSGTVPTGVVGKTSALIGGWIITGGTGEGADINAVKITDDGSKGFGNFQNLEVYYGGLKGSGGIKIGDTQSTLATNTSYTFYPSPYISVNAAGQIPVYVYGDIKTSTTTGQGSFLVFDEADGTGKNTKTSVNFTNNINGQTHYIATAGSLTFVNGSGRPSSANIIGGSGENIVFQTVDMTAAAAEAIHMTKIVVSGTFTGLAAGNKSAAYDISVWDGSDQIGSTISGFNASSCAVFDISGNPWVIPAGADKTITFKAKVPTVDKVNATSGGTIILHASSTGVAANVAKIGFHYKGAMSGVTATSNAAYSGNAMYTYRTNLSVSADTGTLQGFAGTDEKVFEFTVQNIGNYTVYLRGITTTVSYTDNAGSPTTTALSVFYLYDDDLNRIASSSLALGKLNGTLINATTMTFQIPSATTYTVSTLGEPIAVGASKTFIIKGPTSNFAAGPSATEQGSKLQLYIADGADFNWNDGFISGGGGLAAQGIQTTRTFKNPIPWKTLDYD